MLIIQVALGVVLGVILLALLPYILKALWWGVVGLFKVAIGLAIGVPLAVVFAVAFIALYGLLVLFPMFVTMAGCVWLLDKIGFINWWVCLLGGIFVGLFAWHFVYYERILTPILRRWAPWLLEVFETMGEDNADKEPQSATAQAAP